MARPGHQTPDDAEKATDQILKENIIDPEIQEGIIRIQTPAKPLSRPSGAPHPEQYPLVFPTEILITQNPPKLWKVSLKVLDRVGRKGEISGAGEQMKTFLRIFHETAKMSKQHLAE